MFREKHQISKSLALIIGLFCCLGFSSANTIKSSNLNSKLSLSISLNNPNSPNFQAQNFDEGKTKLVQAALTREQEQAIENFLKNNHYLHNIVQQQFTEYINLFLGIIGILGVLIPGSLLWFMYINSNKFKAEIKKKLEEELLFEFQKEVLELGGDISKLLGYMVVMENINLSSDLQFNPPSFETIHIVEQYPRILKYLQKKFRINSLPDIFHVKSGDALSFIGKYYVRKANSTDNEKLKEEARNNLDKSMEAYKKALELKPIEISA